MVSGNRKFVLLRGRFMKHDQPINLESLTVREFCELTVERGVRPTVLLAEYELQRVPIESEG